MADGVFMEHFCVVHERQFFGGGSVFWGVLFVAHGLIIRDSASLCAVSSSVLIFIAA